MRKIHFSGIGGNGMSALAQIHAWAGDSVSGSDRLLDKGYKNLSLWGKLKSLNIKLFPQNGSGVTAETDLLVLSTAIENDNPDWQKARDLNIKIIHRSELLSQYVASHETLAVAGTSGKSTVVAMIFEILGAAGKSPSVITGANISVLEELGFVGNVFRGKSNFLVIEADESDGSLVNYKPAIGILLNLSKDHKEESVILDYFLRFRENCEKFIVNGDEENLASFRAGSIMFGLNSGHVQAHDIELEPYVSKFTIAGKHFTLPAPGLYNVQNAVAAVAASLEMGISVRECADALAGFKGVARRFKTIGKFNSIEVIDDFAHNPAKLSAALSAARLRAGTGRVLAVYQPHGYAPARLLKNELIDAFSSSLNSGDMLWMPEIYYIGGTVDKDISSKDLINPIASRGRNASFVPCREKIVPEIVKTARPGDVVVVMGARDPTLSDFARAVFKALQKGSARAAACRECLLNVKGSLY